MLGGGLLVPAPSPQIQSHHGMELSGLPWATASTEWSSLWERMGKSSMSAVNLIRRETLPLKTSPAGPGEIGPRWAAGPMDRSNPWIFFLIHYSSERSEERRVGKECRSRW